MWIQDLFNFYSEFRTYFKAIIIPVAKKSNVACLNDFCPVPLSPTRIKCFQKQVRVRINPNLPDSLDPLQFTCHRNRSRADASYWSNTYLWNIWITRIPTRYLFIDYSPFNYIIQAKLFSKLLDQGVNPSPPNQSASMVLKWKWSRVFNY